MGDYYSLQLPILTLPNKCINPFLVVPNSKKRYKNAVERIAYYFKREMHFSFVQFESSENIDDDNFTPYEAFLFHEIADDLIFDMDSPLKSRITGVCFFRKRTIKNDSFFWSLDWVWFHPYLRNKGLLTDFWPKLLHRYGSFYIEEPLSKAMEGFLKKQNFTNNYEKSIQTLPNLF